MQLFVLEIDKYGTPGMLQWVATTEHAIDLIVKIALEHGASMEGLRESVEAHKHFRYEDGGGVFLVIRPFYE